MSSPAESHPGSVHKPPKSKDKKHKARKRRLAELAGQKKQRKHEKALLRKAKKQRESLEVNEQEVVESKRQRHLDFLEKQHQELKEMMSELLLDCSDEVANYILEQWSENEEIYDGITEDELPEPDATTGAKGQSSVLSPLATVFTPSATTMNIETNNSSSVGIALNKSHVDRSNTNEFKDRILHKVQFGKVLVEIKDKVPMIAEIEPTIFARSYGHVQWNLKDFQEEEMPDREYRTTILKEKRNERPFNKPYSRHRHANPFYYEEPGDLLRSFLVSRRTLPESNNVDMKRKLAVLKDIRAIIEYRINYEMHDKYTDRLWKALDFLLACRVGPTIETLELKLRNYQRSRLWRLKQKHGRSYLGVLLEMTKENNDGGRHWKKKKQRRRKKNNWKRTLADNTEMNSRMLKAKTEVGVEKEGNLGLHTRSRNKKEAFFLFTYVAD